ncbi:MAG TPA: PqqD family protein [Pyrinomonadaceae bacterium]|nr:PqqD family protein [Pyrinomonadaceae bacterium]
MMTQLKIHPEVRTTPSDEDGSVLINLESGKVFSLNGAGAKVWIMLEQGITFEGLLDSLAREYDVPRQQLQDDTETFIHELKCKGLVQASA